MVIVVLDMFDFFSVQVYNLYYFSPSLKFVRRKKIIVCYCTFNKCLNEKKKKKVSSDLLGQKCLYKHSLHSSQVLLLII